MDSKYWDENFMQHLDVNAAQIVMEVGARYGDETLVLKNKFPNRYILWRPGTGQNQRQI